MGRLGNHGRDQGSPKGFKERYDIVVVVVYKIVRKEDFIKGNVLDDGDDDTLRHRDEDLFGGRWRAGSESWRSAEGIHVGGDS